MACIDYCIHESVDLSVYIFLNAFHVTSCLASETSMEYMYTRRRMKHQDYV